jgi:preprotein translocase SecE subunit
MYKWPQGRVIRTISMILALVIAADLGINGAWANLGTYLDRSGGRSLSLLIVGVIYAVLTAIALIGGLIAIGFKPASVDFLIEVEQEMTRVTWPTSNELIRSTAVIALMIVVLGIGIFVVDWFNLRVLFEALYGSRS